MFLLFFMLFLTARDSFTFIFFSKKFYNHEKRILDNKKKTPKKVGTSFVHYIIR